MRYRLTAEVRGRVKLDSTTQIDDDGIRYIYVSTAGALTAITVETVVDPQAFRSEIRPATTEEPVTFELFSDSEVHDRLLRTLQEIEAHLALSVHGALEAVDWQTVVSERVPETAAEEELVPVRSSQHHLEHERRETTITPDNLAQLTVRKRDFGDLVGLKTFWREANNEYLNLRYIQAFYNFFFILEGLFAAGKSGERQVTAALQSSTELRDYTERTLVHARADQRHWDAINDHCQEYGCTRDVPGILELLVKVRGTLHHFAPEGPRSRVHPFAQADFQTIAWLALGLSTNALLMRDRAMPHPPLQSTD